MALQGKAAVILGGDLNCSPHELEAVMLKWLLPQLQDSWAVLHPDDPGPTSNSNAAPHRASEYCIPIHARCAYHRGLYRNWFNGRAYCSAVKICKVTLLQNPPGPSL